PGSVWNLTSRFRNFGRSGSGFGSLDSFRTSATSDPGITAQNQSHLALASTRRVSISPDSSPAHGESLVTCRVLVKLFLSEHLTHPDCIHYVLHGSSMN